MNKEIFVFNWDTSELIVLADDYLEALRLAKDYDKRFFVKEESNKLTHALGYMGNLQPYYNWDKNWENEEHYLAKEQEIVDVRRVTSNESQIISDVRY